MSEIITEDFIKIAEIMDNQTVPKPNYMFFEGEWYKEEDDVWVLWEEMYE